MPVLTRDFPLIEGVFEVPTQGVKPNTKFELCRMQMVTMEELQILTLLYQPLIGPVAVSLYLTLNTLANRSHSFEYDHHFLLQMLNLSIEDVLELRYKLEAVGLVQVYLDKEEQVLTYRLKKPMQAKDFFSDGIINVFLNLKVGNPEYQQLKQLFIQEPLQIQGENISKPFNEVFDTTILMRSSAMLQASPLPTNKADKKGVVLELSFDKELLFSLLQQFGMDETIVSQKLLDQINRIAFLYKLDEHELARLIFDALDADGFVNLDLFRKQAKQYFQFLNKGKPVEVVDVPKVISENSMDAQQEHLSKEKQLLLVLSQHPLEFLRFKQHQKEPVPADRQLVEWLVVDQQMAAGVVNVLIDYVLNISDGRLPKQLVEKIAGEWQRKEIDTTEKAIAQVKATLKAKQKRDMEKTTPAATKVYPKATRVVRKEQVPDWLNSEDQVKENKKSLTDDDLQKIERMKELQNQLLNQKG